MQEKTHYKVLGIEQDAKIEDVKRAYRELVRRKHPDHGGDPEEFIPVQEAYETLSDEKLREEYDEIISQEASTFVTVDPDFAGIEGDSKSLVCRSEINLTQLVATGCIDINGLIEFCVANEELALSVLNDPNLSPQLLSGLGIVNVMLAHKAVMDKILTDPALYTQLKAGSFSRLLEKD